MKLLRKTELDCPRAPRSNNIGGSSQYGLRARIDLDGSGAIVDATGNYWGPIATAEMQANQQNISTIFDFWDDANVVMVDYSGYLTAPVANAGPDW